METNYYEYFNEYFIYEDGYGVVYTEDELENDFRVFETILKNVYKIGRN